MPRTHASLTRLFVAADLDPAPPEGVVLGREQANYLVNVLRMGQGAELVLFNGRDGAWLARIAEAGKRAVRLEPVERIAAQTPPSDLWYGFAPLKSGRLDYMVQKATEMGVGMLQPVITQFTQVRHLRPDKLMANIVEAAEQCEVLSLPRLGEETTLERLLAHWPEQHPGRVLVFADETAASATPLSVLAALEGRRIGLLVGPEGGFSDTERAQLRRGDFVLPISLGPRILRADTAAVAALAVIQASIGDWR